MKRRPQPEREPPGARINREASEWIAKEDKGLTPAEQDEFFDWLAQDPSHGEVYHMRKAIWQNLDKLAEWRPEHSSEPNPDLLAVSRRIRRPATHLISTCAALAAVVVFALFLSNNPSLVEAPEVIRLASAEGAHSYEYHVLEDGSIVELNRGAQASVLFSKSKRTIHLFSGEAQFTVAKDPDRPFEVKVRGAVVKALGTIFSVSLMDEKVEVLVTEGRVEMKTSPSKADAELPPARDSLSWELSAGQLSAFDMEADIVFPVVEEVTEDEISRRLTWKEQVLDFSDAPLSQVILEFNRRNHTQIVLDDPVLADREVTAALQPHNLDGFLELLELTMGVQATRVGDDTVRLRSRAQ